MLTGTDLHHHHGRQVLAAQFWRALGWAMLLLSLLLITFSITSRWVGE